VLLSAGSAEAQTFREHSRATRDAPTAVDESQADELTLTLVQAAKQTIQTWVRTAGAIDDARQVLTACIAHPDGALVQEGQRVRAFPPDSKSSIYQARVTHVAPGDGCVRVEARLSGPAYGDAVRFVMEVIVNLGAYLAIPNDAIIEREGSQVVYVQRDQGRFEPLEIHTGRRGELYTEVLDGLAEGDQVVTLGSFFIDADHRLKADTTNAAGNAHQHH
jgi:hypothetical protein